MQLVFRKGLKYLVRKTKKIGLSFLLSVLAFFIAAQLPLVKDQVAAFASRRLTHSMGLAVSINGLRGLVPFHVRIDRILVSDEEDHNIEVLGLRGHWPIIQALRGAFHFDAIEIARVRLNGIPARKGSLTQGKPIRFPDVLVRRLEVMRVEAEPPLTEIPFVASVSAEFRSDSTIATSLFSAKIMESEHALLQVNGSYGRESNKLQIDVRAKADSESNLWHAFRVKDTTNATLQITLAGRQGQWTGNVRVASHQVVDLDSEFEISAQPGAEPSYTLSTRGTVATAESILALPNAETILGNRFEFDIHTKFDRDGTLILDRAMVSAGEHHLHGKGHIDADRDTIESSWRMVAGPFESPIGTQQVSTAGAIATVSLRRNRKRWEGVAKVVPQALEGLPSSVSTLVGSSPEASTRFVFVPGSSLVLSDTSVRGSSFALNGDGKYQISDRSIASAFFMSSRDGEALATVTDGLAAGQLSIAGSVSGTIESPLLHVNALWRNAELRDESLEDVRATCSLSRSAPGIVGNCDIGFAWRKIPFRMQTQFRTAERKLGLSGLQLAAGSSTVTGTVEWDGTTQLASGHLNIGLSELQEIGAAFGQPIRGQGHATVTCTPANASQTIDVQFGLSTPARDPFEAEAVSARLVVNDVFQVPSYHWQVLTEKFQVRDLQLASLQLNGTGTSDSLMARMEGEGHLLHPFVVEAEVAYRHKSNKDHHVIVSSFGGNYGDLPVRLKSDAWFNWDREALKLTPFTAQIGQGNLTASLLTCSKKLVGKIELADVPLQTMTRFGAPDLSGTLNADLNLSGTPAEPHLKGTLHALNVRPNKEQWHTSLGADINATMLYKAESLHTCLRLITTQDDELESHLDLPVSIHIQPPTVVLHRHEAATGRVHGVVHLDLLNHLPILMDQAISGQAELDLSLRGTPAMPLTGMGQAHCRTLAT